MEIIFFIPGSLISWIKVVVGLGGTMVNNFGSPRVNVSVKFNNKNNPDISTTGEATVIATNINQDEDRVSSSATNIDTNMNTNK